MDRKLSSCVYILRERQSVNEISRGSRAIESPLGRVSRTPSLHISGSGSRRRKQKNLLLAQLHAREKFWVNSWARLSIYEHFYLLWCLSCQEKTSISKWESTCEARDIYIYLWYQESGLNYVGQGMITGRQVFLYYLSRERLYWTQCMVGEVC